MKFRSLIVAAILLAAGCAPPQPPVIQPPPVIEQPSSYPAAPSYPAPVIQQSPVVPDTTKSQIKDRDRDLSECERESAFASAGDKRQVFNKCMKARGY